MVRRRQNINSRQHRIAERPVWPIQPGARAAKHEEAGDGQDIENSTAKIT